MKILYKKDYGDICDFLTSLWVNVNKDLLEKSMRENNIVKDSTVFNLLSRLENQSGIPKDKLEFFFSQYGNAVENFRTIAYGIFRTHGSFDSFEDMLREIENKTDNDLVKNVFENIFLDTINNLNEILGCEQKKVKFIEKIDCTPNQKWNLMLFVSNPKKYALELCDILKKYYKIYVKNIKKLDKAREKFNNELERNLKKQGVEYIRNISKLMNYEEFKTITVYPLFINYFSFVFSNDEKEIKIGIGFRHKEIIDNVNGRNSKDERYDAILKILGDKSKMNIIRLLNKSELYGSEIAEKLSLTTATVSHHMSQLCVCEVVTIEKSENKTYYKLNKKTLKDVVNYLNEEFKL
ncbi:MAG: ArsR/SmtB family transcription factor [Clostridium sp.]